MNIARARALRRNPPNPNAALNQFLSAAADGTTVFNTAPGRRSPAQSQPGRDAAWSDAAWSDAAWCDAAWSDAAWSDAAWATAAWSTAAWSDAAWSDAAWSDAAWADGADGDAALTGDQTVLDPAAQASALAELGIVDPSCDPTIDTCVLPAPLLAPPVGTLPIVPAPTALP